MKEKTVFRNNTTTHGNPHKMKGHNFHKMAHDFSTSMTTSDFLEIYNDVTDYYCILNYYYLTLNELKELSKQTEEEKTKLKLEVLYNSILSVNTQHTDIYTPIHWETMLMADWLTDKAWEKLVTLGCDVYATGTTEQKKALGDFVTNLERHKLADYWEKIENEEE